MARPAAQATAAQAPAAQQQPAPIPELLTVKEFSRRHPAFTEASVRWLRYKSPANGFAGCFRTVGRKLLVDPARFFAIIEKLNASAAQQ